MAAGRRSFQVAAVRLEQCFCTSPSVTQRTNDTRGEQVSSQTFNVSMNWEVGRMASRGRGNAFIWDRLLDWLEWDFVWIESGVLLGEIER